MAIFTGTTGDDFFTGTGFGDDFHLEQGGDDTAKGGAGVDVFYMGAAFTSADKLNGGGGHDYLILDGDYSAGVTFTAKSLVKVEAIQLEAGHGYQLSGLGELAGLLTVDGSALGVADAMKADASTGAQDLSMTGGIGSDTLVGGGGDDSLDGGAGDNSLIGGGGKDALIAGSGADLLDGGDGNDSIGGGGGSDTYLGGAGNDRITVLVDAATIDAGSGNDRIVFQGVFDSASQIDASDGNDTVQMHRGADGPLTLSEANFASVESLILDGTVGYDLTLQDDVVAAGTTMLISVSLASLHVDGSQETDGHFVINGSYGDDVLLGGALADTLSASNGNDSLDGGGGDDVLSAVHGHFTLIGGDGDDSFRGAGGPGQSSSETLIGGLGADSFRLRTAIDHLIYTDVAESTAAAPDYVVHIESTDQIDLSAIDADTTQGGDQAFHLVSAFSGQAGELALTYDSFRGLTTLEGDVDGDGQADLVILLRGDESGFADFVL